MGALQEDIASFEALDTQVLGVSPDTVETHRRFAESLGLTFPLLSDPDGAIRAKYGSGRIAFFIDKQGLVRLVVKGMPDNKSLLRDIRALSP